MQESKNLSSTFKCTTQGYVAVRLSLKILNFLNNFCLDFTLFLTLSDYK